MYTCAHLTYHDTMAPYRPTEGVVIKVGPGRIASSGAVADIKIKAGDNVKFKDFAGTEIKIQVRLFRFPCL